ncbi:hypothetical protein A9P82_05090 [Arachidicoccus ginsenosidimutans]|uniref:SGNH/GDSL hydrolase family protein n=1 Tax=Arachidicoccus sp. BS20 TaxID=1850526 RepID=UPI0007F1207C|nr:SGNH/GDSL hydrolase family protein [Arachidicoccus sp. BS20]ANI88713.1 hypothetical protein A9P82_05090 [Arachidicoccus sp. BS20]
MRTLAKLFTAKYIGLIVSVLLSSGVFSQEIIVKDNNPDIQYSGRMELNDTAAVISWTGSSVQFNFRGTSVKALLRDEDGNNYYNVIVDNQILQRLHLTKGKHEYILCSGLKNTKHSLQLFKITEAAFGKTWVYQFRLNSDAKLLPPPPVPKRKIVFYGNSITCGYAVEDSSGNNGAPEYENGYLSYATVTAHHFHADFHCISKSGIGIVISWFPLTMPEMYDRLYYNKPDIKWNFTKYTPQIVVVNLFQNDSWLVNMPDNAEFKRLFDKTPPTSASIVNAYESFIKNLILHYPKSKIICALGNMDASKKGSPWIDYIKKAVADINNKNVDTCIFPYKGTPGHPDEKAQRAMADQLIAFINKNIQW